MRLRHFQFALALRAAEDLPFFHFVFVHVDFCGTLWAAEHGCFLRSGLLLCRASDAPASSSYYIRRRAKSMEAHPPRSARLPYRLAWGKSSEWRVNIRTVPSSVSAV